MAVNPKIWSQGMRRSLAIILTAAAIAAFACGGGAAKPKPPVATPTAVSDEAFKSAAESAAKSVQITQADLPAGWTGKPHETDNTKLDLSPGCEFFNEVDPWKSAIAKINSDDFADAADRSLNSQVYRTADLAQTDSSLANTVLTRCAGELSDAFRSYILKDAPNATAEVTFTALTPDELQGWTGGYRLSFSGSSEDGTEYAFSGGWLWSLEGRTIVSLEYGGGNKAPVDASMVTALKSLLAKRIEDAGATLPN